MAQLPKSDPAITTVLDEILSLTQIDPAYISPDERLINDLGLDRCSVQTLVWNSAKKLNLDVSFEICRVGDLSLREIVSLLKTWQHAGNASEWRMAGRG